MTVLTTSRVLPFFVGEHRLVSLTPGVTPTGALRSGQTIASVIWTVEAPLSVDAGTDEIFTTVQSNDSCRVKVSMGTTPGRYNVTAAMTTANPEEVIIETVICSVSALPV